MKNNIVEVDLKWVGSHTSCPEYATEGSAAVDLIADIPEALVMRPGQVELVKTGLSIHIRTPGYAAFLLPRSGLGHKHGLVLGNLTGLIDEDYTGPLMVSLWNRSEFTYVVEPSERIAQCAFLPVGHAIFNIVEEHVFTARGDGGFGHSGRGIRA